MYAVRDEVYVKVVMAGGQQARTYESHWQVSQDALSPKGETFIASTWTVDWHGPGGVAMCAALRWQDVRSKRAAPGLRRGAVRVRKSLHLTTRTCDRNDSQARRYTCRMRVFAVILLICCVIWQGVPAGPSTAFEVAHSGWHAQGDLHHHHHDDGSAHFDESDESLLHTHVDQGAGTALLLVASNGVARSPRPPSPDVLPNARRAHWSPDVPLRPPSA